jgi:hypothetical protein
MPDQKFASVRSASPVRANVARMLAKTIANTGYTSPAKIADMNPGMMKWRPGEFSAKILRKTVIELS